jgi:hypothetical protein
MVQKGKLREMWKETWEASLFLIGYLSAETEGKHENVINDPGPLSRDLKRTPAERKTEIICSMPLHSMAVTVRGQEHWTTRLQ